MFKIELSSSDLAIFTMRSFRLHIFNSVRLVIYIAIDLHQLMLNTAPLFLAVWDHRQFSSLDARLDALPFHGDTCLFS